MALSIILAPQGPAAGVLDALQDLSALGLVDPFVWVTATPERGADLQGVTVARGEQRLHGKLGECP